MLKLRLIIFFSGVVLPVLLFAQNRMSTEEYVERYKDIAVKKMKEYGIPASITLAQGILESGSGNSKLARKANNHFGIKCHKDWKGKTFYMDDDEEHECFRKYSKAEDSYRDHSLFLTQRGRYSFLFNYNIRDYKKWAHGLKKAGYATNPKYPQLLIRIIEEYDLAQYDTGKTGKKKRRKEEIGSFDKIVAPVSADLIKTGTTSGGRQLYTNNGKKLIIAEAGDNYYDIAQEFGIYSWQLYKYNDVKKKHELIPGEFVYLEKKKRKADKKFSTHIVLQGESMRMISQIYGIKLSRLYKINNLPEGIQVSAGTKLKVR